jgi:hypothetical protein
LNFNRLHFSAEAQSFSWIESSKKAAAVKKVHLNETEAVLNKKRGCLISLIRKK